MIDRLNTSASLYRIAPCLSKGVFERRTATGNETFFSFYTPWRCHIRNTSVVTRIETIYLKIRAHPLPKNEKRLLPVAVRRSKKPLLKLPINKCELHQHGCHLRARFSILARGCYLLPNYSGIFRCCCFVSLSPRNSASIARSLNFGIVYPILCPYFYRFFFFVAF